MVLELVIEAQGVQHYRKQPASPKQFRVLTGDRPRNTSQIADEEGEIHCLNFGISSLSLLTSILSAVGGRIGGSPLGISCMNTLI